MSGRCQTRSGHHTFTSKEEDLWKLLKVEKKPKLLTKEPRLKNRICKMNSAHEEVFFMYIDDVAVGQTAVI